MTRSKPFLDAVVIGVLGLLTVLTLAHGSLTMPNEFMMVAYALALVAVAAFLVLFWNERPADEREAGNQLLAGRVAYMTGTGCLIIALTYQGVRHDVDAAVPLTLLAMVASKLIVQAISNGR